jgi:hemoglobin
MSSKHDIVSKEDLQLLVDEFYKKVNADALLAPFFRDIRWDHHLPHLVKFWNMVLFNDTTFDGNAVASHVRFPLETKHFDRCVQLFHETLDEHFAGGKMLEAKERASNLAVIFQYQLGILPAK